MLRTSKTALTAVALSVLALTTACVPESEPTGLGSILFPSPTPTPTPEELSQVDFSCSNCRGPNPTVASAEALAGPFEIATTQVIQKNTSPAMIYYPTASGKPYSAVVITPGLGGSKEEFDWLARRLASNGIVAMTIDSPLKFELPLIKVFYIKDAFDQLTQMTNTPGNPLTGRIDPNRMGAIGHSAGGGTVVKFAQDYKGLPKAIMPLSEGGNLIHDFDFTTPAMFFHCRGDLITSPERDSITDYNMIKGHKVYIEAQAVAGAEHNCPQLPNVNQAKLGKYALSWMKLWLDRDWRYYRFICGADKPSTDVGYVLDFRSTCPA